jgi:hypothetical protein
VPERERADDEAGHDLVAHPEQQRGVEHLVRQRDRRRHGDDVPAEQRQLHAVAPLRDAVAHGRHSAGDLPDASGVAQGLLEQWRVGLERPVGGQHVVVRGHDGHVRFHELAQCLLVRRIHGGEPVREVRAAETAAGGPLLGGPSDALEVAGPGGRAAFGDAVGHRRDGVVQAHG